MNTESPIVPVPKTPTPVAAALLDAQLAEEALERRLYGYALGRVRACRAFLEQALEEGAR